MKVYRISKATFWAISLLILVLPLSRHWRLMVMGKWTRGTVEEYTAYLHELSFGEQEIRQASKIRFPAGDSTVVVFGPPDHEMNPGRIVRICYYQDKPSRYCLLTMAGFYSSYYSVVPIILLILWLAFYHSFNYYRKRDG